MQLSHRNIVRCFGAVQLPYNSGASAPSGLAVVLEGCEPYTLRELLTRSMASGKRLYKLKQAVQWLLQIASALAHLHSRKPPVTHRDLQPDDVLLKREATGELTCRLADLGLHHEAPQPSRGGPDAAPGGRSPRAGGPSRGAAAASPAASKGAVASPSRFTQPAGAHSEIEEEAVVRENPYFDLNRDDDPSKCSSLAGATPAVSMAAAAAAAAAVPAAGVPVPVPSHELAAAAAAAPVDDAASDDASGGRRGGAVAEAREKESEAPDAATTTTTTAGAGDGPPSTSSPAAPAQSPSNGSDDPQQREGDEQQQAAGRAGQSRAQQAQHARALGNTSETVVAAARAVGLTADSVGWYRDSLASHSLNNSELGEMEEEGGGRWSSTPRGPQPARGPAAAVAAVKGGGQRAAAGAGGKGAAVLSVLLSDPPDSLPDSEAGLAALQLLLEELGLPELKPLSEMDLEWFYELQGTAGSFMYMAPEVYRSKVHTEKSDVFSFGVLAYELLAGELLVVSVFNTGRAAKMGVRNPKGYAGLVADGYRPPRIHKLPDSAWALLEACWQADPVERPSMAAVVSELQRIRAGELGDDGGATRGSAGASQAAASGSGGSGGSGGKEGCVIS